jgi:ATP adenylyltransferase
VSVALRRGSLWPQLRARSASALLSGALQPLASEPAVIEERGIEFQVRVLAPRKPSAAPPPPPGHDPFLPFDPELFVADVSAAYVCLLNKYPLLRYHALLCTREFAEQEEPLGRADFEALWACLSERDALGFYNAGPLAGASQRHRHLQLVPPLVAGAATTPLDDLLEAVRFDAAVGSVPGLPFLHAFAWLRDLAELAVSEAAVALTALYREMARAFGCERAGRPYNLLVTRDWMLFVPRSRESWEGIPVNALGYAGALVVPDRAALARLRGTGPLDLLRHVGVSG